MEGLSRLRQSFRQRRRCPWAPRIYQGDGRHDNPTLYGALYAAANPLAAIVEALAPFRGTGNLDRSMLHRAGRPLALAELQLDATGATIDLDEPAVLLEEGLCPSTVATRDRHTTQRYAVDLFHSHEEAIGIEWWSTLESSWAEATFFDVRAADALSVVMVSRIELTTAVVQEAARFLGLV